MQKIMLILSAALGATLSACMDSPPQNSVGKEGANPVVIQRDPDAPKPIGACRLYCRNKVNAEFKKCMTPSPVYPPDPHLCEQDKNENYERCITDNCSP